MAKEINKEIKSESNKEIKPESNKRIKPENKIYGALVKFIARRNDIEPEFIEIRVNGNFQRFQREKWVPVSILFLEALKNAKEPVYSKPNANENRKVVSWVPSFPYSDYREITESQYQAFRNIALSRDITNEDLHQIGV